MTDRTGLVLEGGGFRAVYIAAVLEVFHRRQLFFPYGVGVSAGAAYGVSYVSRQQGRNLETNYFVGDKRYCGIRHCFLRRDFFNWEFIFKEIPTSLVPLDYAMLEHSTTRFFGTLTNCLTGKSEFHSLNTASPDKVCDILAAGSSLPYVSKIKTIDQIPYLDGGIADAIPLDHAKENGIERLVVVLTRPKGYLKEESKSKTLFKMFYHKYPRLVETMNQRVEHYNNRIKEVEMQEKEGNVFIIRPNEPIPVGRMENDPVLLEQVYWQAIEEVDAMIPLLQEWLKHRH